MERFQTAVREFQLVAEGDSEVVDALAILAGTDGHQLLNLYDEVLATAIAAGIDDIYDLLCSEPCNDTDTDADA